MEGNTGPMGEEKDERECNVIVYGKLESEDVKWGERKASDLAFIQQLFSKGLGLDDIDIILHHRLGQWKHETQQQRPLKVVLTSVKDRDIVLSRSYRLHKNDQFKGIRLSADLTFDERKELSSLWEKAKQLTAEEGDTGFKHIVRDKSVIRVRDRNKPLGKKGRLGAQSDKEDEKQKEIKRDEHKNESNETKGERKPTGATDPSPKSFCDENKKRSMDEENMKGKSSQDGDKDARGPATESKGNDLLAEQKSKEASTYYAAKNYRKALSLYTEAIGLCPSSGIFYWRRSATYIMMEQYKEALSDASKAVTMLPNFAKGNLRLGKCHLLLGNLPSAVSVLSALVNLEPDNQEAVIALKCATKIQSLEKHSLEAFAKKNYSSAIEGFNACIETCPGCATYKTMKAECLCLQKKYKGSLLISRDVLRLDSINADAVYVMALCKYLTDSDQAMQLFQDTLRLNPDHAKAKATYKRALSLKRKKAEGNKVFSEGRYTEAINLYSEALDIDPNNDVVRAKLFYNRAMAYHNIGKLKLAISDCSEAIKLDQHYIKAYIKRAKCFMKAEKYVEAIDDFERILELNPKLDYKKELSEAKTKLRQMEARPVSLYQILGVNKFSDEAEIKKAYKMKALQHHPDRHSGKSKTFILEQERKFKQIGKAYEVLSDPVKKRRYDLKII